MKTAWINITTNDGTLLERVLVTESELASEASRFELVDTLKRALAKSDDTVDERHEAGYPKH